MLIIGNIIFLCRICKETVPKTTKKTISKYIKSFRSLDLCFSKSEVYKKGEMAIKYRGVNVALKKLIITNIPSCNAGNTNNGATA